MSTLEEGRHPDDSSDSPILTDTELYQALKSGQSSAIGLLYDRYGKLVYGLALHILRNPQEAEDLTQEIFLALWSKNIYNPTRGSLSSFLTILTRSRAIDKLRSRNSSVKILDRWQQNAIPETSRNVPFENASGVERSEQIQNALSQLSENQRQVLEMLYYEDLSQAEIAQRLKIPLGTVKTRSRLGLLRLRQILKDFMG